MKRVVFSVLFGLATSVLGTGDRGACPTRAQADSGFRCPSGRLVSTGDHMVEVRQKCGEPDFVSQRTEKRKIKVKVRRWTSPTTHEDLSEEREIDVLVDEWTYDFGSDRFIRFVSFEDARVVGVTTGSYGGGT
jgi:hypothetical protein